MGLQNVDTFDASDLKLSGFDEKSIKFTTKDDGVIRFQAPKMRVPFEKKPMEYHGDVFAYNLSLSTDPVSTDKNQARIEKFKDAVAEFERNVQALIPAKHAGKEFSSSLWQGANAMYGPIFRASMYTGGSRPCVAFNNDKEPVGISEVERGQIVATAIRFDKVWANANKVGINWTIEQLKICESADTAGNAGFSIRED